MMSPLKRDEPAVAENAYSRDDVWHLEHCLHVSNCLAPVDPLAASISYIRVGLFEDCSLLKWAGWVCDDGAMVLPCWPDRREAGANRNHQAKSRQGWQGWIHSTTNTRPHGQT
jgi:hypothetical protein